MRYGRRKSFHWRRAAKFGSGGKTGPRNLSLQLAPQPALSFAGVRRMRGRNANSPISGEFLTDRRASAFAPATPLNVIVRKRRHSLDATVCSPIVLFGALEKAVTMIKLPNCRNCSRTWKPRLGVVASQGYCHRCSSERRAAAAREFSLRPLTLNDLDNGYLLPRKLRKSRRG